MPSRTTLWTRWACWAFEELNARAGRQAFGYVEPGEAAWEILEEVVEPGLDEIKRLLSIGLEDPARAQCEGYAARPSCRSGPSTSTTIWSSTPRTSRPRLQPAFWRPG